MTSAAVTLARWVADQLDAELADCVAGLDTDPRSWTRDNAATTLRRYRP